jgi:hypothetical protein
MHLPPVGSILLPLSPQSTTSGQALDRRSPQDRHAAFIVHTTRLIAEDLRDILLSAGYAHVTLARTLADIPLSDAGLIVIDGTLADLAEPSRLEDLVKLDLPMLVLDGLGPIPPATTRIERVSTPFRSEEVIAALSRVTRPRTVDRTDPA